MEARKIKHMAMLQEWTVRINECRSSGKTVTEWCEENKINPKTYYHWEREYLAEATKAMTVHQKETQLIRLEPAKMPGNLFDTREASVITIRHGETVIELPEGTSTEAIASLVSALNRHA